MGAPAKIPNAEVPRNSFLPTVLHYFALFRRYAGARIFLLVILPIFSSLLEGVGISAFLPILAAMEDDGRNSRVGEIVSSVFGFLGLSFEIRSALLLLAGVFILKSVFEFWRQRVEIRVVADVADKLRGEWLELISRLDYLSFLTTNVGRLANTVSFELTKLLNGLQTFTALIATLVTVAGLLAINLWVDWRFTLIGLLLGAAISLFQKVVSGKVTSLSRKNVELNAEFQSLLIQSLYGFKYLVSTDNFSPLRRHMADKASAGMKVGSRIALILPFHQAVTQPAMVLTLCGLIYWQTVALGKPIAVVATSLMLFYRVTGFLLQLQGQWIRFGGTLGPTESVLESLAWMRNHQRNDVRGEDVGAWGTIELKRLSFSYPGKRVLDGIDLSIRRNSTVAFVGESGSGKTTLMDLLTGLLVPTAGELKIGGISIREVGLKSWRSKVGYVAQDSQLFNDTIFNNITLWSGDRDDERALAWARECARMSAALEFIESLPQGWDTMVGDRGSSLSGGQKQRIAIARELFRRPEVLLLDEATSALDSETENLVREAVDSLSGKTTIVVIAHRLSTVQKADRIYVLKDGSIEQSGSFAELFSQADSLFRKMCDQQRLGR